MIDFHDESIFNMALAYLKRIDKLFYICAMASMKGDIFQWNNILRAIYRELSIKITDKERTEIEGEEQYLIDFNNDDKLNSKETYMLNHLKRDHANFQNINLLINNPKYCAMYKKQILYLLDQIEIKIRIKMQEKGMLLPSKDDPRRAITRR